MSLQREQTATAFPKNEERQRDFAAALRRIGKGNYGICVDCGENIAPGLLAAEPWIAYCTTCQDATVAERSEPVRWFDCSRYSTDGGRISASS